MRPLIILSRAICTFALSGARPRHQPAAHGGPARPLRQGLQRCAHLSAVTRVLEAVSLHIAAATLELELVVCAMRLYGLQDVSPRSESELVGCVRGACTMLQAHTERTPWTCTHQARSRSQNSPSCAKSSASGSAPLTKLHTAVRTVWPPRGPRLGRTSCSEQRLARTPNRLGNVLNMPPSGTSTRGRAWRHASP